MSEAFIECKNCEDHLYLSVYPETAALIAERDNLKRANDLLQRQVCDFANTRPALIAERDALRGVLLAIKRHGELANVSTGGWNGSKPAGNPMSKDVWQFPRHLLTDLDAALGSTTEAAATPRPDGCAPTSALSKERS